MSYYLNRSAMRVVERNERGNVIYRKRYKFGDEVDVDHLEDGRLDALVESGALVESEDDLRERRHGAVPVAGSQLAGAATGEPGENPEHDTDRQPEATGDEEEEDDDEEMVDEYSSMDYRELQDAARKKGINPNQRADDLRTALRA